MARVTRTVRFGPKNIIAFSFFYKYPLKTSGNSGPCDSFYEIHKILVCFFFQNLKGCVILTEIIKKNLPESRNLGESEKNHRIVSDNGTTAYLYVTE